MHTDDPVLDLMDRFTGALNSHDLDAVGALVTDDIVFESTSPPPDGTRYEGWDAVRQIWGEMLAATPQARFSVEEQFSDGTGRAVVRWRYDWADGHVRGVVLSGSKWPARRKPGLRQGLVHHHHRASADQGSAVHVTLRCRITMHAAEHGEHPDLPPGGISCGGEPESEVGRD